MFLDYLWILLCPVFLVASSDIKKTEQAISNLPFEWVIRLFRTITYNNNAFHFQQITIYEVHVLCGNVSHSQPTTILFLSADL